MNMMWFIMLLLLIAEMDKKVLIVCFTLCCLTEAFDTYLSYQSKKEFNMILEKSTNTYDEIIKTIAERRNNE